MIPYDHPTAFSLWGEEEWAAIARVMASGRFTMGQEVEAFEEEFAAAHGRRYGVMVNSGSSANLVAVAAMFNHPEQPLRGPRHPSEGITWDGNGHGRQTSPQSVLADCALVPAVAWSTTYAPLVQHGLRLELADVDDTWNARPKRVLSQEPDLIVICSILGNPCYGAQWTTLANEFGALALEDNCESFWAIGPDGRRTGTHGDIATFSFFHSHQISAIEGGMILTDDDDLARLCRMLRAHGWSRDVETTTSFEREYDFRLMGYNVRPVELHAAIAREQLKKADLFQAARLQNAIYFQALVQELELPVELPRRHGRANPFGLHFLCHSAEERARLVPALRGNGIDCRLPTGGSFRRHVYGKPWADQMTPIADAIHDRGLFVGNAPFDISLQIDKLGMVIRDALVRAPA